MEYFYILTIVSIWGKKPTEYSHQIRGPIQVEHGQTRSEILGLLQERAVTEWRQQFLGVSFDEFRITFFSLEKDSLD